MTPQPATELGEGIGGLLRLDPRELHRWSFAKKARQQRRRSCLARSRTSRSSASAASALDRSTPRSSSPRTSRLSTLVEGRQFDFDLYYRLNGVDVQVPPLRARREDIPELARYLERHHTLRPLQVSAAALDALVAYDWPGNVRELERVIERAVALAGSAFLEPDDLPPALLGGYVDVLQCRPSARARR